MAIQAKCGSAFREVERELRIRAVPAFVYRMAGIAAQIESLVTASTLWNTHPGLVTTQAEILLRGNARRWLQQFILGGRGVRVMTG